MSRVSERVSDASPPEWGDRAVRSLALEALALLQASQSGASSRLDQRDAPSLAMSTRTAEERDSQPAQRDELAHSHTVPTRGGVLPPADDPSPTAITENTGSLHGGEDGISTAADTTARPRTCSSLAQVCSAGATPSPPRSDTSSATSPTSPAVACDAGHSDPSGATPRAPDECLGLALQQPCTLPAEPATDRSDEL